MGVCEHVCGVCMGVWCVMHVCVCGHVWVCAACGHMCVNMCVDMCVNMCVDVCGHVWCVLMCVRV